MPEATPRREKLSIEDWQKRLEENFSEDGILGGSVLRIAAEEDFSGIEFAERYKGHDALICAFQAFYLETLKKFDEDTIKLGTSLNGTYPHMFAELLIAFRRHRAAMLLSSKGYVGTAFSVLRDLKDKAIQISAVMRGVIPYEGLYGIHPGDHEKCSDEDLKKIRRRAKINTERRLNSLSYGEESGLSKEHIATMQLWADLFNLEVHGSSLSFASSVHSWLNGEGPLHLVGSQSDLMDALYMNRMSEISWMIHRVFPAYQCGEEGFGEGWTRRWVILDESFWQMQVALSEQNEKAIGEVFVSYIDEQFPFVPSSRMAAA